MRWLDFRASFSRGPGAGLRATKRLETGLLLSLIVAVPVLLPQEAGAYALSGDGRVVRVDALVVWDGEKQVLALLPQLHSVGEGGFLLLPLPPGAELMLAPDPDMFQAPDPEGEGAEEGAVTAAEIAPVSGEAVQGDREGRAGGLPEGALRRRGLERVEPPDDGEGEGVSGRGPMDLRDRFPRMDRRTIPVPGRGPVVPGRDLRRPMDRSRILAALRGRQPPLVRLEEDPVILPAEGLRAALRAALGDERYDLLPSSALDEYVRAGWSVAMVQVPAREGRIRFGPLAFSMALERPTIPVRLAAGSGRHQLSIRFISAEELTELGQAAVTLGLRHTQRPVPVDAALGAWMNAVGFDGGRPWRVHGLGAGPLDTVSHPLSAAADDLLLPAPPRVRAPPEPEAAPVSERKTGRGCGCLVAEEAGAPFGGAVLLFLLFSHFAIFRRSRSGSPG